ncbi:septation ring formation regulator EzrA [Fredinandcohnia quinoae]|uniref:Septation ring formation regulator EzrA n=1 Tax=Fredinandcohnia quinoae TaxID=2918902 RepID=A0AAW5EC69_9BACI|nr:septation ring formation regulator EzrA [Fredinandcohnia sp. SECRCQ15]MCH1627582.1 septation ring formation regulator EzrA [Fredinandcohnia sp. SECRCQ15]
MEIIIGIIVVVVGVIIFGFYSRKKIYKEVDRLEAWKIDMMNRPVTDEISKVKELNMTGQTEELFERWRREWDEVVTVALPDVEELLFDAEDYADKYRFTKAKKVTGQIEAILNTAESNISKILEELKDLVGSEEKNRVEIDELKIHYRELKKTLLAHRHTFGKSEIKLESKLDEINGKFAEFEDTTNHGNYFEAREIVLIIKDSLQTTREQMNDIPDVLQACQTTIPNQLDEILEGHAQMGIDGFLLDHIHVEKEIEQLRSKAADYIIMTENLEVEEVKKGIEELKESMDTLYDLLEEEVKANQFVNTETEEIAKSLEDLVENSKKTEDETTFVQQSYRLTEDDLDRHRNIVKEIKQLVKQYVFIQNKLDEDHIAYSIIRSELENIYRGIQKVKEDHFSYSEMLQTLRKDEMHAREKISEMRKTLIEANRIINKSNIPGLPQKYTELVADAKHSLTQVVLKLEEKPLNMNAVNNTLQDALDLITKTYESTEEMIEQVYLAEKVIQYGNRYRRRNQTIAESLQEAELSFRNYDYALALEQAATAIEDIEPGALKRIEKLIEME